MRGLIRYDSLKDGTLDLADVLELNEAVNVEIENNRRAQKAEELKHAR